MASARDVARKVLDRVERDGAFAAAALESEAATLKDKRDSSLATELVLGVLRRRPWLDRLLDSASSGGSLRKLDVTVRNILRIGVYQIAYLDRIPVRAAVFEAVSSVKRSGTPRLSGLVNALLRNLAAREPDALRPPADDDGASVEELALRYGLPGWLLTRLIDDRGTKEALGIARVFNDRSARTMRVNTSRITRVDLLKRLSDSASPGPCLPWSINVSDRRDGRTIEEEGLAAYQDEGAGLVVAALDPKPGSKVLDACAGRGGKTGTIAMLLGDRAEITAADRSRSKLDRAAFELNRQGFSANTVVVDLQAGKGALEGPFDRILLDAPCSGTGTLGRRPEIRWRLSPDQVASLVSVQRAMLDNVAPLVVEGGRLVYAVCSILKEEGEKQIESFLEEHPEFELVRDPPYTWPDSIPWRSGLPFIDPSAHGTDGYFIACLARRFPGCQKRSRRLKT